MRGRYAQGRLAAVATVMASVGVLWGLPCAAATREAAGARDRDLRVLREVYETGDATARAFAAQALRWHGQPVAGVDSGAVGAASTPSASEAARFPLLQPGSPTEVEGGEGGEDRLSARVLAAQFVDTDDAHHEAVHAALVALATSPDAAARAEVAKALAVAGTEADAAVLEALRADPSALVRAAAAHALLRIERRHMRGLSALDWGVIAAYGVGMIAVGWYFSRRTRTTEDYLLGGRSMRSSSVGLSLFATLLSTITYLALPGEMIKYGPVILFWIAMLPVIYLVVGYLLIPYITRLPVTSAYEILEGRLGMPIRLFASGIFLVTRLVWMALIIYLTADKVIVVMMGWSPNVTPFVAAAIGLITVVYTSMGGLRAVVFTDVAQSLILFGGAVLSIILITVVMGGVSAWWPTTWAPNWGEQPFFSRDPHVRVTVVGSLIFMTVWWICTAGSDQMAIQRYLATRDAKAARRAFLVTSVANVVVNGVLAILGFALLGYFQRHPEFRPDTPDYIAHADNLFPYFIVNFLPVGIAGLVISGLLAAAMSSLSSGINSSCSVISVDFVRRFRKAEATPAGQVRETKVIAVIAGLVAIGLSALMREVPGNIMEVTVRTNHVFVAPLFALFFMAMFVPFATPFGAGVGAIYGCAVATLIAYWDLITGDAALSFQWISLTSLVVNLVVGCAASLVPTKGVPRRRQAWGVVAASIPMVVIIVAVVVWFRILPLVWDTLGWSGGLR